MIQMVFSYGLLHVSANKNEKSRDKSVQIKELYLYFYFIEEIVVEYRRN